MAQTILQSNVPSRLLTALIMSAEDLAGKSHVNECVKKQSELHGCELSGDDQHFEVVNNLLGSISANSDGLDLTFEIGANLSVTSFGSYGRALYSSPSWDYWCCTAKKFSEYIGIDCQLISVSKDVDKLALQFNGVNQSYPYLQAFYSGVLLRLYLFSSEARQSAKILIAKEYEEVVTNKLFLPCSVAKESCLILSFCGKVTGPRFSNAKVHSVFVRDMTHTEKQEEQHPLAFHVQKLIEAQAKLSHVNQSWVAEQLHMSERSLLRKLKLADISFRDLFNKVRSKRSLDLLFTGLTIADIADALGYSERATFERAFKSWQGITPVAMQSRFASLAAEHKIDSVVTAESIPTPPTMLPKLVGLIGDDDFHIDELVEIIDSDPVVTSKVLSIANSALYGYSDIESVKQAILTVLGVEKLQAIVITILSTEVFSDLSGHFPYDKFWFRSLASAQISMELAELRGVENSQRFTIYIAALLHNIGHLGIAYCLAEGFDELVHDDIGSLPWREQMNLQRLRLGIHSVQVTEILLNLWEFPSDIIKVLRDSGVCSDFLQLDSNEAPSTLNQTLRLVDAVEAFKTDESGLTKSISTFLMSEFESKLDKNQKIEQVTNKIVSLCDSLWVHSDTLV